MKNLFKYFKKNFIGNHNDKKCNNEKLYGAFPAGHYYSPIPTQEEIIKYINRKTLPEKLPEVNLNKNFQYEILNEYYKFYNDLSFPEKKSKNYRYYYNNDWFSYSDAIFLYSFLRKNKPKKIIEIGSGFSTAVILDTVEFFFSYYPEITLIEPYPQRLNKLLKSEDKKYIKLFPKKIQDISLDLFNILESGDFLFIDSSHVLKCGSDLQLIFFEILPYLPSGIFVHFHDIFYPFEYPEEWLMEGRYWNENYFLRAFLAYNSQWSIYFFNSYVFLMFNRFLKEKMPLCIKNPGGSIYLRKNV